MRGAYGRSEAVRDGAGELTEVAVSLKDRRLRVTAGTEELFAFRIRDDLPVGLEAVGVWVVPRQGATGRTALFDWIEVTGLRPEAAAGAAAAPGAAGEFEPPVWLLAPETTEEGAGVGIEPTTCGLKVRCSTN